jgi:hypothetical protein
MRNPGPRIGDSGAGRGHNDEWRLVAMDHKKVARRQNRHEPSEDTIAEARRIAQMCLARKPPTLRGLQIRDSKNRRDEIERARVSGLTPKLAHLVSCSECLKYWIGDAKRFDLNYPTGMLAAALIERGEPLPTVLRPLIAAKLRELSVPDFSPSIRDVNPRFGRWIRDSAIGEAVTEVCKATGLSPTRNPATDIPSGCSIVADALLQWGIDRGEALVEKAWRKVRLKGHATIKTSRRKN